MPVGLRGYTQGSKAGVGYSVAWPAGTAAGDMCLVHTGGTYTNLGPQGSGWTPTGHKAFWKILTDTDLAGPLIVNASHVKLQVFSGARGVGRTSTQNGLKVQGVGSYLYVESSRSAASIAPATYRLGVEWRDERGYWQASYALASGAGWAAVPSMGSGTTSYSYELMPASVPSAPILASPAAGATINQAAAQGFSWQHQSAFEQTGYRLRLTTGATVRWVDSSGALQATEQSVTSSAQQATVNASVLTSGAAYTWAVATQDANGWSVYSAERAVNPIAPPSVTSVTVASPAEDLSPEVSWAATAGYGVIEAHQTWIAPAAVTNPEKSGALWTSGVIANTVSPDAAPSTVPWVNGQSLRAWVRVWQSGGVSAIASSDPFTVTWTPPAAPTVTVDVTASPPLVSVTGVASGRAVQIEQRLDGTTWTPLATRTASSSTLPGIPSPLAAIGTPVGVRARQAAIVDGVPMWSAWSAVVTATAAPAGCWVVDDSDRATYLVAHLASEGAREKVQGITASYGLGAASGRVDRTPEAGERGSLVWIVDTQAERDALLAFLDARSVFWIVFPPDDGVALPAKRVARVSPRSWERLAQTTLIPHRHVPLSWVEQV